MARLKTLGALAVVLALLTAGTATANYIAFPLQFPTTSRAHGAMGTVANDLAERWIGCWADTQYNPPIVTCMAWQKANPLAVPPIPYMTVQCSSGSTNIWNIYQGITDSSYLEFEANGVGDCTFLGVQSISAFEPKR